MNPVHQTIICTYRRQLAAGGVDVLNMDNGTSFRALPTAGELVATFGLGDQEQDEQITLSCVVEDAVPTGTTLRVDGKSYVVQRRQARPTSPLVRLYCKLQPGEPEEGDDGEG